MRVQSASFTHHVVGVSLLLLAVLAVAAAQHVAGQLTIPVMDQMAADMTTARSTSSDPVAFPFVAAQAVSPPAPAAPAPASEPGQLLGEVHVSAGDAASRPSNPTPADPLRIAFASGVPSSVRVTIAGEDGVVVATLLDDPSAAAGPRAVEWSGAGAADAPVPDGRYTLRVEASEDADVKRLSTHELHVYVARPVGPRTAPR